MVNITSQSFQHSVELLSFFSSHQQSVSGLHSELSLYQRRTQGSDFPLLLPHTSFYWLAQCNSTTWICLKIERYDYIQTLGKWRMVKTQRTSLPLLHVITLLFPLLPCPWRFSNRGQWLVEDLTQWNKCFCEMLPGLNATLWIPFSIFVSSAS